jgi:hypothetical protein
VVGAQGGINTIACDKSSGAMCRRAGLALGVGRVADRGPTIAGDSRERGRTRKCSAYLVRLAPALVGAAGRVSDRAALAPGAFRQPLEKGL